MMSKFKEVIDRLRKNLPGWLNSQNLIFITVILAFTIIVLWSESLSQLFESSEIALDSAAATATTLFGTPTPLPDEWLRSAEQTNGIILGAIIIILAIVAGTAVILIRDRD